MTRPDSALPTTLWELVAILPELPAGWAWSEARMLTARWWADLDDEDWRPEPRQADEDPEDPADDEPTEIGRVEAVWTAGHWRISLRLYSDGAWAAGTADHDEPRHPDPMGAMRDALSRAVAHRSRGLDSRLTALDALGAP